MFSENPSRKVNVSSSVLNVSLSEILAASTAPRYTPPCIKSPMPIEPPVLKSNRSVTFSFPAKALKSTRACRQAVTVAVSSDARVVGSGWSTSSRRSPANCPGIASVPAGSNNCCVWLFADE